MHVRDQSNGSMVCFAFLDFILLGEHDDHCIMCFTSEPVILTLPLWLGSLSQVEEIFKVGCCHNCSS